MKKRFNQQVRSLFLFSALLSLVLSTLACQTLIPSSTSQKTLPAAVMTQVLIPTAAPTEAAPTAPSPTTAAPTAPAPTRAGGASQPTRAAGASFPALKPELGSIGDPYAPELGNQGYDVQNYNIQIAVDPANPSITAQTTITAAASLDGLDQVWLDFVGFDIQSVTFNGTDAVFQHQGDKLIVAPPAPLSAGEPFTITVAYSGEPVKRVSRYVPFFGNEGLQFRPDNVYVVSEPDGARFWFPSNDHPRDKAAFRYEVTVPKGMTAAANGELTGNPDGEPVSFPDGKPGTLFTWDYPDQTATYLATIALGNYQRIDGKSPKGIPLRSYVTADQRAAFEQYAPVIGEAVDWMSETFGPYPFKNLGYATVKDLGASLETQTLILLDNNMIDEGTIIHEMAHQWYGDWISPSSWGEAWRNEGFATYVQLMWSHRNDPAGLDAIMAQIDQQLKDSPSNYPLNNPPPDLLFGRDSYVKGAALLHALRKEIGDEAFFNGLHLYYEQYGGKTASDADFQVVMEKAAGRPLDDFFSQWLAAPQGQS